MTAALHLASEADLDRLLPMVTAFHTIEEIEQTDDARHAAVLPLLTGNPHGAIWMIGPRRGPVGYIAISFGWSIGHGGMAGRLDEFYIRQGVRGRGMGSEVLAQLLPQLAAAGLVVMTLELATDNAARRLYQRRGFTSKDGHNLLTWLT